MIITETVLCKEMNAAKKGAGYIAMKEPKAGNMIICTDSWCVEFMAGQTPRKVLGRLVEHIGKLPEKGEALRVRKKEVQTEIYDVAAERWTALKEEILHGQSKRILRTHFQWKGFTAWQCPQDLRVMFFDPDVLSIAKPGAKGGVSVQDMVYFQGGISSCFIRSTQLVSTGDAHAIDCLEQTQWAE